MPHYRYEQATGFLSFDGQNIETCYSGHGEGRCNPAMQHIMNVGPIPCGWYTYGELKCRQVPQPGQVCGDCGGVGRHTHGPDVLHLIPDTTNEMYGRAGFLIHGDNPLHDASEGCIIASHPTRLRMGLDLVANRRIEVVPGVVWQS
jgi:hypothetical protein